jgi:hypothetical protein
VTSEHRRTETTESPEREAGPEFPDGAVCSAKGCRAVAAYDLRWNNPKIHPPDRRKHWLACPEHRESLSGFLSARGFLREVEVLPASG